jgi:solute carrier family 8 (sodium/calcium exchanger)
MGSGNSLITVGNTTVDLNDYKCSDRGLILPLINEYTWPVWLRGVIYLVFLLYLFLGIAIIADIFMGAISKITSKTTKIMYPDPYDNTKYVEREIKM